MEYVAASMSEKELQQHVIEMARHLGYRVYHTFDSRRSESGYPDLTMLRMDPPRAIVAELKREKRQPTPAQEQWLAYFEANGIENYVWRPSDWLNGTIERELR